MNRAAVALLLAITAAIVSSNAFALSISVDTPTQYTLDDRMLNAKKNASAEDQTMKDVSGFKVLLAGPQHIGVGYERYVVDGKGVSGGGAFKFAATFQFYDVFLDLPARWLNFGLGYGVGTVNSSVDAGGNSPMVKQADASQWFASIGIPLGEHFDVHAAYHAVTAKDQGVTNTGAGGTDAINVSGHTIMAGVRLAW